jgi:hypothetical protein
MANETVDVEKNAPPSECKSNSNANSNYGPSDQIAVPQPAAADISPNQKPLTNTQENLFMFFITLTQLVQMIPLGAGINSGLAIGEAVGATHIQSVWITASYPLTQGAFVLIGKLSWRYLVMPKKSTNSM